MKRYTFAAVAALLVLAPWQQAPRADSAAYTVEALPTFEGRLPAVVGINASGQVVGNVSDDFLGSRAVRYTDGIGWEYLNGVGWGSTATGINVYGDVSGYRLVGFHNIAFRYSDGLGVEDIAPLVGGQTSMAMGINDTGEVAGYGDIGSGSYRAWRAAAHQAAVQLPTLGGDFGQGCGINKFGQVAMNSSNADGMPHSGRVETDEQTWVDAESFFGPTGMSQGCAVDDTGHVGGYAGSADGSFHAFRLDGPGHLVAVDTGLPTTFSNVESISNGASAGWFINADGESRAFLHTDANGAVNLNDVIQPGSGWVLFEIKGINASGQMVGDGQLNGTAGIFRLSPPKTGDHTAPTITSLSVDPSVITPANNAMVTVHVAVTATDDTDPNPSCSITAIDTHGSPASSASISGQFTASVQAADHALYTLTVTCSDSAKNTTSGTVDVVVPADTTAPVIASVSADPASIYPPKGQMVTVKLSFDASDDSGAAPVCKLANVFGPGTPGVDYSVTGAVTGSVKAVAGRTYTFVGFCVDGSNNVATKNVDVTVRPDTTAPVISSVTVSPSSLWPPDGRLVPVSMAVVATDDVDDAPGCSLTGISSSTPPATDDFSITGKTTALLRAVGGRTYTLTATCSDSSGNSSQASAPVVVPRDTTPPAIVSFSASPGAIWPPNNKMVAVSFALSVSDNVDASPKCSVALTSGAPGDAVMTGPLSANVRANNGAVYVFTATCSDRGGNASAATATVSVTNDNGNGALKGSSPKK